MRNKNKRKKVLLLGDSIRMGYDDYVKEILSEYDVYYDELDNGKFSSYTIWQFNQLNKKYGPFDIVHFNTGYWDMNKEGPNKEPQTPINTYISNLEFLISLIKETGSKIIFATTTPICDDLIHNRKYQKTNYRNKWVIDYNKAAIKLMKKLNIPINDLYKLLLVKSKNYYKCKDSLHLTEEGYKLCANKVALKIKEILSK